MTLFIILYIVGVIVAYPLIKAGALAIKMVNDWTLFNRIAAILGAIMLSWAAALIGLLWFIASDKRLDKKVKW